MFNADEYIAKEKAKIQKKIDAVRKEAHDNFLNWADTGNTRYTDKQEKLNEEADKLNSFIHPAEDIEYYVREIRRLEDEIASFDVILKGISNVVDDMKGVFPDCTETRRLEDFINNWKWG